MTHPFNRHLSTYGLSAWFRISSISSVEITELGQKDLLDDILENHQKASQGEKFQVYSNKHLAPLKEKQSTRNAE